VNVRVEGLEEAVRNLNEKLKGIEDATQAAFWEAGLKIMRATQLRLRASVITGNLRASGYVRCPQDQIRPDPDKLDTSKSEPIPGDALPEVGVELGFTAMYALYAHENMEGRAPKFLESAIRDNEGLIVQIIKERTERDGESST